MLIIEQNSEGLFIADKNDNGGPEQWRKEWQSNPNITFVKREDVVTIQYIANPILSPMTNTNGQIGTHKGRDISTSEILLEYLKGVLSQ
jgi:hypothetical protein